MSLTPAELVSLQLAEMDRGVEHAPDCALLEGDGSCSCGGSKLTLDSDATTMAVPRQPPIRPVEAEDDLALEDAAADAAVVAEEREPADGVDDGGCAKALVAVLQAYYPDSPLCEAVARTAVRAMDTDGAE